MPQVPLNINGRSYRLGCGEGDEARLKELAQIIARKVDGLVAEFGQAGESRLLLMAALLVADELVDTRTALDMALAEQADALRRVAHDPAPATAERAPASVPETAAPPPSAAEPKSDKSKPQKSRIELPGKAGASR